MNIATLLFTYNRPEHTAKVLEGLRKNNIKELYVFSDGPAKPQNKEEVYKIRKMVKEISWCKIHCIFNDKNKGLAESIINGISYVFSLGYDAVIILEDDCVPSSTFIEKMQVMLKEYDKEEDVMHVSGFGLPIKKHTEKDVYFTPYPCSWGWGTWKDTWEKCDFYQQDNYKKLLSNPVERKKFNYAGEAFSDFLSLQLEGKVNSWLIRWYYYIFSNNGRCVWCYDSLIDNKGFDGTGEHKVRFDWFNQKRKNVEKSDDFLLESNKNYNKSLISEFRRYFKGNSILEKIKTIIYLLTGLILEKKR